MPSYGFKQVDAFTSRPLFGNPVAVILGADGLTDDQMQRVAAWTNLSETTFVLTPTSAGADYRLRIFTPGNELPFAGHPTIGSAHAILEAGVITPQEGRFVMECGAGDLRLRVEGGGPDGRIWVEAPEAKFVKEYEELWKDVSEALGRPMGKWAPATAFDNGPVWLFARYDDAADIALMKPDMSAVARLSLRESATGIAAFAFTHQSEGEPAVHIRCFAPAVGVPEDPVTGSANAALPAYLARYGLLEITGHEYVASQGTAIGRDGRVAVRVLDDNGRAEIGGPSVTVVQGTILV